MGQRFSVFSRNGLAGSGKPTVFQMSSQVVAEDGTLGASFFVPAITSAERSSKTSSPRLPTNSHAGIPHSEVKSLGQ